tara:strand:- start:45 stop:1334 length:1290 start_codon:yes stop_codon:yes gene_type:complete
MTTRITSENITDATIGTGDLASSVPLNTQWQAVVTASTLNAAAGKGYFIDTSSNACTVTITASGSATAGDTIVLKDYARNWDTNAVTLASNRFDGVDSQTPSFSTKGQTVTLVHMGATKGWSLINEDTTTGLGATYISATGGTVTTSGDYKIHSFTGDGNFVVASVGNSDGGGALTSYLVVAGGGGSGSDGGGGGGAGGFREGKATGESYTVSPLNAPAGITLSAQTYPITVGAGGATAATPGEPTAQNGSNSIFSTITSAGGGRGAHNPSTYTNGANGGSGGGGRSNISGNGGTGNTPPVSPAQGTNGGGTNGTNPPPCNVGAGGGGATAAGQSGGGPETGDGGVGATTHITGSPVAYAGGGGGGGNGSPGAPSGGAGGGGNGGSPPGTSGSAGSANTGGGAGGGSNGTATGAAGGKGIVILRYKYQN